MGLIEDKTWFKFPDHQSIYLGSLIGTASEHVNYSIPGNLVIKPFRERSVSDSIYPNSFDAAIHAELQASIKHLLVLLDHFGITLGKWKRPKISGIGGNFQSL